MKETSVEKRDQCK